MEKANLLENFPSDLQTERVCIYDNKKNQFLSVFYYIPCSVLEEEDKQFNYCFFYGIPKV